MLPENVPFHLTLTARDEPAQVLELPAEAVSILVEVLEAMAQGRGVSILRENVELTSVEAAEALQVSRPFLIKLLEEGAIAHCKVGKHRRVRVEDLLSYKRRIDREREAVLDQLAVEAQHGDMGYPRG